jgi:demethylmenaquinone methyltransferase/2-methoxy-6-polyprenyl-1,4-benzoquinol methylase
MTAPTLPRQAELPQGDEKRRAVRQMFDSIAPRYEMVNTVMTFGLDRSWRRRCIDALDLWPGSVVLDVACGTGDLCRDLLHRAQLPVGIDISPGMLRAGTVAHGRLAPVVLADGLCSPFADGAFDGAVSGFALRNVVDLGALFAELARVVRPGGRISLLDMAEPELWPLRLGHRLWVNHGAPMVGSVLSDAAAYRYLPRSLAYLPPAGVTVGLLEEAGFGAVQHDLLSGGVTQLFVATRKARA